MAADDNDQIAGRTVRGSAYSVGSSGVTIVLGFLRTTIMLRLLAPEDYGVTALALFYLNLVAQLRGLGLESAFIHHQDKDEPGGDGRALSTYFSLHMALNVGGILLLLAFLPLLQSLYAYMPMLGVVLAAFMAISLFKALNAVPTTIARKRLQFREIAIADVVSGVTMTVVGPLMAWQGFGVWSIVAERASGVLARFLYFWLVVRPWRPRFSWDRELIRWYLRFGGKVWAGANLTYLIDRFDDFWIGSTLGDAALGFYSRAYEYARYPRRVISNPILSVFFPAFASLQEDRLKLSRAFFRSMSLMVRGGVWLTLVFVLTAPEFIRLLLTEKWLPMLLTFQLMIVYTLLDPLSVGARNLIMAVGRPGVVMRIRLLQAAVFVPAVILLSTAAGIEGVALAANLMILLGTLLFFRQTRQIIDYSQRILWLWPLTGLLITTAAVMLLVPLWQGLPLWAAFAGKALFITLLYGAILWLAEREQLVSGWQMIWGLVRPARRPPPKNLS